MFLGCAALVCVCVYVCMCVRVGVSTMMRVQNRRVTVCFSSFFFFLIISSLTDYEQHIKLDYESHL